LRTSLASARLRSSSGVRRRSFPPSSSRSKACGFVGARHRAKVGRVAPGNQVIGFLAAVAPKSTIVEVDELRMGCRKRDPVSRPPANPVCPACGNTMHLSLSSRSRCERSTSSRNVSLSARLSAINSRASSCERCRRSRISSNDKGVSRMGALAWLQAGARVVSQPPTPDRGSLPVMVLNVIQRAMVRHRAWKRRHPIPSARLPSGARLAPSPSARSELPCSGWFARCPSSLGRDAGSARGGIPCLTS
jgi:hypothetical protein